MPIQHFPIKQQPVTSAYDTDSHKLEDEAFLITTFLPSLHKRNLHPRIPRG